MKTDKRILQIMIFMGMLFLVLICYLSWFELFQSGKVTADSYNRRQWALEDNTVRGRITDRNGVVLAQDKGKSALRQRVYPYGQLYSQVIGYSSREYGKSLLELSYNRQLLGISPISSFFNIGGGVSSTERFGYNLRLTLDHNLQSLADRLMGSRKGAAVALDPRTGKILALVSKPGFDPNQASLSKNWGNMVEAQDSPFLPRATMGLYAPGSTYKVLISAAAIENGLENKVINDRGKVTIDGKVFENTGSRPNGIINFEQALSVSSNVFFTQTGVELGFEKLKSIALRAGLNKTIPFDYPVAKSRFPYTVMSKTDMASAAIGQGRIQVTPFEMALITASIANKGVMMKPYLVEKITDKYGKLIKENRPQPYARVMNEAAARKTGLMMEKAVAAGTGGNAAIKGIRVAGKTGTAENELTAKQTGKEHTWFIGFAPADNPQIAVAVMMEYSGSTGGMLNAPVVGRIIDEYLKLQ